LPVNGIIKKILNKKTDKEFHYFFCSFETKRQTVPLKTSKFEPEITSNIDRPVFAQRPQFNDTSG